MLNGAIVAGTLQGRSFLVQDRLPVVQRLVKSREIRLVASEVERELNTGIPETYAEHGYHVSVFCFCFVKKENCVKCAFLENPVKG